MAKEKEMQIEQEDQEVQEVQIEQEEQVAENRVAIIAESAYVTPEIRQGVIRLRAASGGTVYSEAGRVFATGVYAEIPAGYVGLIVPERRLNADKGIMCQGMVMPGESGSIAVTLFNRSSRSCDIQQGEVIAELIVLPYLPAEITR